MTRLTETVGVNLLLHMRLATSSAWNSDWP